MKKSQVEYHLWELAAIRDNIKRYGPRKDNMLALCNMLKATLENLNDEPSGPVVTVYPKIG